MASSACRPTYQKHTRNISTVSDVSVATTVNDGAYGGTGGSQWANIVSTSAARYDLPSMSTYISQRIQAARYRHRLAVPNANGRDDADDPGPSVEDRSDDSADLRIIVLADSETERQELMSAMMSSLSQLSAASSVLSNFRRVTGQWDVPTKELSRGDVSPNRHSNGESGCLRLNGQHHPSGHSTSSADSGAANALAAASLATHLRFTMRFWTRHQRNSDCQTGSSDRYDEHSISFRLMVMSKDKHNLLKTVHGYDLIVMAMRVQMRGSVRTNGGDVVHRPANIDAKAATTTDGLHGDDNDRIDKSGKSDVDGVRVADFHLDDGIWEFEWKRLIWYARRAVAPLVVMSYIRPVDNAYCSLPGPAVLSAISDATTRVAALHRSLSLHLNFHDRCLVEKGFASLARLAISPGHLLHQCARTNNLFHFCRIVDSAVVYQDYESLLLHGNDLDDDARTTVPRPDPNSGQQGRIKSRGDLSNSYGGFDRKDTPLMVAAKLRRRDMLNHVLRLPCYTRVSSDVGQTEDNNVFVELRTLEQQRCGGPGGQLLDSCTGGVDNCDFNRNRLASLIHARNEAEHTLLSMVALQGPEMEEQKLLILRKEIDIHCESNLTHEADQLKLQRCLRAQLKSSAEAAIILEQVRALQGIPKTERELKSESCKVWTRLFFSSLLMSLLFNAIDTGSDVLIVIRYYSEWMGRQESFASYNSSTCGEDETNILRPAPGFNPASCASVKPGGWSNNANLTSVSIQCFPQALSSRQRFGYTLSFILVPWLFFVYEFFTSSQCHALVRQARSLTSQLASLCTGVNGRSDIGNQAREGESRLRRACRLYWQCLTCTLTFLACLFFWPIAVLFIKYYNDCKYYLSRGRQRAEREKKIEASEVLYSTARVMEVSLESSFQPTIQLYLLFPVLFRTVTANSFSLRIFTVCKNELNFPMLKTDQTISIVTSILSLAWCFTTYHATLKRGALNKDLAALFYRAVLFLSILFQIVGRLFVLVIFAYSFGPGMYFPLLLFLSAHIVLMTTLHFVFSDASQYWVRGGFLNLSFFHYMIGNGLANVYIHNWIRMDPLLIANAKPRQHVSTLIRQLIFDAVFMTENVVLLAVALNTKIQELAESRVTLLIVLLGFSVVGLVLKAVYYRYLHLWAWLISDYVVIGTDNADSDGTWRCVFLSNMFLCGQLRERRLTLCCLPSCLANALCGRNSATAHSDHGQNKRRSSCSLCSAIVITILMPVILAVGLVVLIICSTLAVVFAPVFLLGVLPCVGVHAWRARKRRQASNANYSEVDQEAKCNATDENDGQEMQVMHPLYNGEDDDDDGEADGAAQVTDTLEPSEQIEDAGRVEAGNGDDDDAVSERQSKGGCSNSSGGGGRTKSVQFTCPWTPDKVAIVAENNISTAPTLSSAAD